jgi:hypothetical protein
VLGSLPGNPKFDWLRFRTLSAAINEGINDPTPCQHWFKYMDARWADELVAEGKIRVGTLFDYRRREKFSGGRLDEEEGTAEAFAFIEEARANDDIPELGRNQVRFEPDSEGGLIKNLTLKTTFQSPNAFVFCVSKHFDPSRLLADFSPADACVEITDPVQFAAALNAVMIRNGRFIGSHECRYNGRTRKYTDPHTPSFVAKDPRFAHQAEVRIGWLPYMPFRVAYVDLINRDLRQWCRRIL